MSQVTAAKLFFVPVHSYNLPYRELVTEVEQPSAHWPNVTRVIDLYEDVRGMLCVMACFRPAEQPGHLDKVRCYMAPLGPRRSFTIPREAVDLTAAAERCEEQMLSILSTLHGAPAMQVQAQGA